VILYKLQTLEQCLLTPFFLFIIEILPGKIYSPMPYHMIKNFFQRVTARPISCFNLLERLHFPICPESINFIEITSIGFFSHNILFQVIFIYFSIRTREAYSDVFLLSSIFMSLLDIMG